MSYVFVFFTFTFLTKSYTDFYRFLYHSPQFERFLDTKSNMDANGRFKSLNLSFFYLQARVTMKLEPIPGTLAMKAGIHPEWHASLSQGTIHTHPHTRSFTSSSSNPPTCML